MNLGLQSISLLGSAILMASTQVSSVWAQGQPVQGPTGEPRGPSLGPPVKQPPIGGPRTIPLPEKIPAVRSVITGPPARLRDFVPLCQPLPDGNCRSFQTIEGSLREERSNVLVFTGSCFGRQPKIGGMTVTITRGNAPPQPFFRPIGVTFGGDMLVRSWSPTRMEFTVPVLLDRASVPLAPTDVLNFSILTQAGIFRAVLTKDDVDRLERDGVLTFPHSP
jgi:hypothetical protein